MKKTIFLLLFLFPNLTSAASMSMIGETGKESEVSKIIEIKMYDNYYEPNIIEVKKGETIKFVVINLGELVHEFNIATKEMHIKHQPEMMMMVEKEILLGDRIDLKKNEGSS